MHDVLAHRLSLIALTGGRSGTLPETVLERLALLRTTSTEALADLRDTLGALHGPGTAAAHAVPVPVLRDVRELVEEARTVGQQTEMDVEG